MSRFRGREGLIEPSKVAPDSNLAASVAILPITYNGSPSCSIGKTRFEKVFRLPIVSHALMKTGKKQCRNPIYLAKEWRGALDRGEYSSPAVLARRLKVSRARVTQILNLLNLNPHAVQKICSLGDPMSSRLICERKLRPLLTLTTDRQVDRVEIMLANPRTRQN
jgi:type IV secretory pathway protease TraF